MPIAAITPISFHGIFAGGPGAGRGTVEVGDDTNGSRLGRHRTGVELAIVRSPARASSPSTRYASLISAIWAADASPPWSG